MAGTVVDEMEDPSFPFIPRAMILARAVSGSSASSVVLDVGHATAMIVCDPNLRNSAVWTYSGRERRGKEVDRHCTCRVLPLLSMLF
jgi:hypothetical protein